MYDFFYNLFVDSVFAGARVIQADSLEQADAMLRTVLHSLRQSSGGLCASGTLSDQRYHVELD